MTASTHRNEQAGFSLLETMIAMLLLLLVLLSVVELFGLGAAVNKAADDLTQVTALATERLEQLKYRNYVDLTPGGSLTSNVAGYFDLPDIESDGEADYVRRWLITDSGTHLTLEVRVVAELNAHGAVKETTVGAVMAPR